MRNELDMAAAHGADADSDLSALLRGYSAEVTAHDRKGLEAAVALMRPGAEVSIACVPGESTDRLVAAAKLLRQAGLVPVPHLVARNMESRAAFNRLLERLAGEAGLDRALLLGGDRDKPSGELDSSLQLIETGFLRKHGVGRIGLAIYPEGHPRIADAVLAAALSAKLEAAKNAGLDVWLISQFCFDAKAILALARRLRAQGVRQPFRIGVAGPAKRSTLIKYALTCGVGASMRALKERQDLARNVLAGETPEALLREVAAAQSAEPALGLSGVHLFTFGSLAKSAAWADSFAT
ncbi:MAG TPA: methylenetetrahydrofolate reductase [Caulobacteraceae bacterium]|nr:methylenetetrahydrofolate reductase [Caulobacteraceae bacterium]